MLLEDDVQKVSIERARKSVLSHERCRFTNPTQPENDTVQITSVRILFAPTCCPLLWNMKLYDREQRKQSGEN